MVSGNLCMASMLWCPGIATPPRGQAWFLVPALILTHLHDLGLLRLDFLSIYNNANDL